MEATVRKGAVTKDLTMKRSQRLDMNAGDMTHDREPQTAVNEFDRGIRSDLSPPISSVALLTGCQQQGVQPNR